MNALVDLANVGIIDTAVHAADVITWTPSAGVKAVCRTVAGFAIAVWVLFVIFKFLFPGKGSRNAFRSMGAVGVLGALIAIVLLANIDLVPSIGNWIIEMSIQVWNMLPGVKKAS